MKIKAEIHDTLLQHHALYPKTSHDLQAVASQHLACRPWKSEFDLPFAKLHEVKADKELEKLYKKACKTIERESGKEYKTKKALDNARARFDEAVRVKAEVGARIEQYRQEELAKRYEWLQYYNAMDTIATDRVDEIQSRELEEEDLWAVYENDREIMTYAIDWFRVGVGIDHDMRARLQEEYNGKIEELRERLCAVAGYSDFNPASPKQLQKVLVERAGVVPTKLTANGDMSTAEDALFNYRENPFVKDLLEFRELSKLESTYIRGIGSKVGRDGRLHPNWKKHVTPSGRFSTSPAIQNWPDSMKRMLVPTKGRMIIACDYAALELRIASLLAGEEELINEFTPRSGDVHSLFAATYFTEIWDNATQPKRKQLRKDSKPVTFGDIYRASAPTLFEQVRNEVPGITLEQVAVMQARKRARYNNFNIWAEIVTERANREQQLKTPWLGRIRRWPLGDVPDTEASNHPVQGGAADIVDQATKRWIRKLKKEGLYHTEVWPNIQIHDDLRAEVLEDVAHDAAKMLVECMEIEIEHLCEVTGKRYTMPFYAEAEVGYNHAKYDAKENPQGLREIEI